MRPGTACTTRGAEAITVHTTLFDAAARNPAGHPLRETMSGVGCIAHATQVRLPGLESTKRAEWKTQAGLPPTATAEKMDRGGDGVESRDACCLSASMTLQPQRAGLRRLEQAAVLLHKVRRKERHKHRYPDAGIGTPHPLGPSGP